jgi:hypothetical protein
VEQIAIGQRHHPTHNGLRTLTGANEKGLIQSPFQARWKKKDTTLDVKYTLAVWGKSNEIVKG